MLLQEKPIYWGWSTVRLTLLLHVQERITTIYEFSEHS